MKRIAAIALVLLCLSVGIAADTLELKNGQTLSGTYRGGTETSVRFELADGRIQTVAVTDIVRITFGATAPLGRGAKDGGGGSLGRGTKDAPGGLPAGTVLMVETRTPLLSGRLAPGDGFVARMAEAVSVAGQAIIAAGDSATGVVREARAPLAGTGGRARLVIELLDIRRRGKVIPLDCAPLALETDREGGLRRIDDNGGTTGTAESGLGAAVGVPGRVTADGQIQIPVGTVLTFRVR